MWNWIKGKITRMVVEQKVTQLVDIVNSYSDVCDKVVAPAFMYGAGKGLQFIPNSLKEITKDQARLVRIAETWVPVMESIRIALDLSKEDLISIVKDVKPHFDAVANMELTPEILAAADLYGRKLVNAVEEIKK